MNDVIYDEMIAIDADGVDFVPIWGDRDRPAPVICSFSKKDWLNVKAYPKSCRLYWRIDKDGRKQYIR